jgi:hypothetical protein
MNGVCSDWSALVVVMLSKNTMQQPDLSLQHSAAAIAYCHHVWKTPSDTGCSLAMLIHQ